MKEAKGQKRIGGGEHERKRRHPKNHRKLPAVYAVRAILPGEFRLRILGYPFRHNSPAHCLLPTTRPSVACLRIWQAQQLTSLRSNLRCPQRFLCRCPSFSSLLQSPLPGLHLPRQALRLHRQLPAALAQAGRLRRLFSQALCMCGYCRYGRSVGAGAKTFRTACAGRFRDGVSP